MIIAQTNPNHVWVNGYTRSNGTYVEGYYRTAPNHTNTDNFSTVGNINPYTGQLGYIKPDGKKNPWASQTKEVTTYAIEPYVSSASATTRSTAYVATKTKTKTSTSSAKTTAKSWYSKGDQVNVRFSPNTSSKVAYRIDRGDQVRMVSQSTNKDFIKGYGNDYWYKIEFNGLTGWVFGKLIGHDNYNTTSIEKWHGEYVTVNADNVNVRTEPSTAEGKIKFQLSKSQQIEVLAKSIERDQVSGYKDNYWYYIRSNNKQGWVFGALINDIVN